MQSDVADVSEHAVLRSAWQLVPLVAIAGWTFVVNAELQICKSVYVQIVWEVITWELPWNDFGPFQVRGQE